MRWLPGPVGAALVSAGVVLAAGLPFVLSKPAAPIATTDEVEASDQLWRDLEALHAEDPPREALEFRERFVALTAGFLRLNPEREQAFRAAVDSALAELNAARRRLERVHAETAKDSGSAASIEARKAAWERWREEQYAAADLLLGGMDGSARHRLLAERRLLWLLSLDQGLRRGER